MCAQRLVSPLKLICELAVVCRGRYNVELHLSFLRLQGQANDFKIQYSSVVRLFLLPKVLPITHSSSKLSLLKYRANGFFHYLLYHQFCYLFIYFLLVLLSIYIIIWWRLRHIWNYLCSHGLIWCSGSHIMFYAVRFAVKSASYLCCCDSWSTYPQRANFVPTYCVAGIVSYFCLVCQFLVLMDMILIF